MRKPLRLLRLRMAATKTQDVPPPFDREIAMAQRDFDACMDAGDACSIVCIPCAAACLQETNARSIAMATQT